MQNTRGLLKGKVHLKFWTPEFFFDQVSKWRNPFQLSVKQEWIWNWRNFVVNDQSLRIETVTSLFTTSFEFQILKVIQFEQVYDLF